MRPFALLVHFLKDIRVHKPSMQFLPANPERILQILSGPCTKTIERHRKRRDSHLAHAALLFIRRQRDYDVASYPVVERDSRNRHRPQGLIAVVGIDRGALSPNSAG